MVLVVLLRGGDGGVGTKVGEGEEEGEDSSVKDGNTTSEDGEEVGTSESSGRAGEGE